MINYTSAKQLKINYLYVLFLCLSWTTSIAQKNTTYEITGEIEGLGNANISLSLGKAGDKSELFASAKDGKFTFKGNLDGAAFYILRFPGNEYLNSFACPGEKILIKGTVGNISKSRITGAAEAKAWTAWSSIWDHLHGYAGTLFKKLDSIEKAGGDTKPVEKKLKEWDDIMTDSVDVFVKKYPSSPISPWVISNRFVDYPNPAKAELYYGMLKQSAKNSYYGTLLGKSVAVNSKTAIGKRPDFTMVDSRSKPFRLSSLKGKVVLVDFWASWCGPCRKENPNLVNAYTAYHGKGFEIVGISLDDKKDNWLKAIKADQLNWVQLSDLKGWKNELALEYGVRSIPMNFLVDGTGKIIAKDLRGKELEIKLKELLK